MAILLSLTALGLLALIVYLLHSHQQQQKIDSVDRTVPLPPLDGDIRLPGVESPTAAVEINTTAVSEPEPEPEPEPESEPPAPAAALPEPTVPSVDWLARSRALKEQDEFDQALEIARGAFPQIGAFRQACVILRAQLREARKAQPEQHPQQEAVLGALYHTCALAAFFHGSDDRVPPLSLSAQRRLRERSWLTLAMPYDQLGTLHLDLLTTTDIRLLTAAWGKPSQHQQVRHYHADAWNALQESL